MTAGPSVSGGGACSSAGGASACDTESKKVLKQVREMIINTGSRTDIPAYFSSWFYRRIEEGYVMVRNPYYPEQVTRYALNPAVVDALSFCTKNPGPMLNRLAELRAFGQFWYVTITPYGKEIEPGVPDKEKVMDSFCRLAEIAGVRAVGWRYDPIFITEKYSLDFHLKAFRQMAGRLAGHTRRCVISFIDLYEKTRRNFPGVRSVTKEERRIIGREFAAVGREYGIRLYTCCEGDELEVYGIDPSGCMTKEVIEEAIGRRLAVPKGLKPAREGCRCLLGSDIGVYNSCPHGCLYCYANYDKKTVEANLRLHDSSSPFLIGGMREGDRVTEARQVSWADDQLSLFAFLDG